MIIGITRAQKYERIETMLNNGFIKFAWWPVELHNGTHIWLEKYWADPCRKDRDYPTDLINHNYPLCHIPFVCKTNNYDLQEATVIKLKRMGQ